MGKAWGAEAGHGTQISVDKDIENQKDECRRGDQKSLLQEVRVTVTNHQLLFNSVTNSGFFAIKIIRAY